MTEPSRAEETHRFRLADDAPRQGEMPAIRELQELRSLFDNAPDVIARFDREYRYTYVSRAAERVTGLPASAFSGRSARELGLPAALCDQWEAALDTVFTTARPLEIEFELQTVDGVRAFHARLAPEPDATGVVQSVLAVSRDITGLTGAAEGRGAAWAREPDCVAQETARHAATERAAERMGRLQAVTAALARAVTLEQAADIVMEQAVAATDARAAAVVLLTDQGTAFEVVHSVGFPPDVSGARQRFPASGPIPAVDVVRTGEAVFLESLEAWQARYPHLADVIAAASAAFAALPLTVDERVEGILVFEFAAPRVFDADERSFLTAIAQQYAQALHRAWLYESERRARADAEAANRAKSDFLAMMSHELRTPLNAIAGYTQLMQFGVPEPAPPSFGPYLQRIEQNQRHLLSLINSVLNFARIETGRLEYVIADAVVDDVLREVEPLVAPQVHAKQLAFECVLGDRTLVMRADVDKVMQILLNLVSNAVKFTDPGGCITLAAVPSGGEVLIRVSDTGCGISADKLETIFDPFVQLDNRLTRQYEGVGLGLAISRDLALGMGGNLTAVSQLGAGATFTLILPRG